MIPHPKGSVGYVNTLFRTVSNLLPSALCGFASRSLNIREINPFLVEDDGAVVEHVKEIGCHSAK